MLIFFFFFFKQKTAYDVRISDWSSDVCSSDLVSEGFATLETILSLKPDTKVIVASGHGARESALRAISSGAYDFYQKPVDIDQLGLIVRRAFQLHGIESENRRLESQVRDARTVPGPLITAAPEMHKLATPTHLTPNPALALMLLGPRRPP